MNKKMLVYGLFLAVLMVSGAKVVVSKVDDTKPTAGIPAFNTDTYKSELRRQIEKENGRMSKRLEEYRDILTSMLVDYCKLVTSTGAPLTTSGNASAVVVRKPEQCTDDQLKGLSAASLPKNYQARLYRAFPEFDPNNPLRASKIRVNGNVDNPTAGTTTLP